MKHYWILGLFGIALYFVAAQAKERGWFSHSTVETVVHAAPAHAVHSDASSSFRWSDRLDRGQVIEIKGVNGSVAAEPARGREVEVIATKTARRSDPNEVRIEVVKHDGGATICAVYPSRRERNECAPGDAGRLGSNNNDTKIEFTVRVPEGTVFVGKTVNGSVKALDLESHVRARTVNGSIEIGTTGTAEAQTVNGSVTASLGSTDGFGDIDFQTVNGRITVSLPDRVNAALSGQTMNGSISTDFPLTVSGRRGPKRLSGVLGDGGPQIDLQTVNGSIQIIRGN